MRILPGSNFGCECPKVSAGLGTKAPQFEARCFESATDGNFEVGNRKSTLNIKAIIKQRETLQMHAKLEFEDHFR